MRGDDHRLAVGARDADDAPLRDRHLFGARVDAEVAAGHHDAVGPGDDAFEFIERRRLLDLGYQRNAGAEGLARQDEVVGALHEGEGDVVDAEGETEFEIGAVLGRDRRELEQRVRQIDAFAVADHSADHDARVEMRRSRTKTTSSRT